LKGNRTCLFKQLTTGKKKFEYKYNYTATGGDPAGGCGKTLEIVYNCLYSGGPDKTFKAPPEAGFDANVVLNCEGAPKAATGGKGCSNYKFIQGGDVPGSDVGHAGGPGKDNNIPIILAACDANPACLAINNEGWMKNRLVSYGEMNKHGHWVNNPVAGTYAKLKTWNEFKGDKSGNWTAPACAGGAKPAAPPPPPADKCKAPMGNPPAKVAGWTYKGCYKDCHQGRGLPNRLDNVKSIEECIAQAKAKGFNTSGNQYFGECWAGNNTDWNKMGDAGCCEPLGGGCTQQIYTSGGASSKAPPAPVTAPVPKPPASLPVPAPLPKGASSGCEGDAATLRCESGVLKGIKYKYGKWNPGSCPGPNSGTNEKKFDEKVITPGECVGKPNCSIGLGNQWGDPWGGTRKEWVATPVCGPAPAPPPPPPPPPPAGPAGDLGCWNDTGDRQFKSANHGRAYTVEQCIAKAKGLGHQYAAIQDGNECYSGNDSDNWKRFGKASGDCPATGGGWKAHVYSAGGGGGTSAAPASGTGTDMGCWMDTGDRQFKSANHGRAYTPATCSDKARQAGHMYAAVQDGNECYSGNDSDNWKRFGKAPGDCPPTGGPWKARVYKVK
jgi:hypothetical protein